jgi:hypothetical protein
MTLCKLDRHIHDLTHFIVLDNDTDCVEPSGLVVPWNGSVIWISTRTTPTSVDLVLDLEATAKQLIVVIVLGWVVLGKLWEPP